MGYVKTQLSCILLYYADDNMFRQLWGIFRSQKYIKRRTIQSMIIVDVHILNTVDKICQTHNTKYRTYNMTAGLHVSTLIESSQSRNMLPYCYIICFVFSIVVFDWHILSIVFYKHFGMENIAFKRHIINFQRNFGYSNRRDLVESLEYAHLL